MRNTFVHTGLRWRDALSKQLRCHHGESQSDVGRLGMLLTRIEFLLPENFLNSPERA